MRLVNARNSTSIYATSKDTRILEKEMEGIRRIYKRYLLTLGREQCGNAEFDNKFG